MEFQLPDQNEREAIVRYNGDIFISAGAGSGKSTTLANRLIYALRTAQLQGIDKLVAITFTNKAATELKWKIEGALQETLESGDVTTEEKERLSAALLNLGQAQLGTIHAYCAHLLREFPEAAGLDHRFKILDKDQGEYLAGSILERYIDENLNSPGSETRSYWQNILTWQNYYTTQTIKQDLLQINSRAWLLSGINESEFHIKNDIELKKFRQVFFEELKGLFLNYYPLYDAGLEAQEEGSKSLGYSLQVCYPLISECETYDELKAKKALLPGTRARGRVKYINAESDRQKSLVKNVLVACLKLFAQARSSVNLSDPDMARAFESKRYPGYAFCHLHSLQNELLRYCWFKVGLHFSNYYRAEKNKLGLVDYDDLLIFTRRLLDNREIRNQVQKNIELLMVDEYQDTDPLQTEIFNIISADQGGVKLFRVGDEKQSIYRFRGADLETYRFEKEKFSKGQGHMGSLRVNLRSHGQVLSFINMVFAEENSFGLTGYQPLLAFDGLPFKLNQQGAFIDSINIESETKPAIDEIRHFEATLVAEKITSLLGQHSLGPGKNELSVAVLFQSLVNLEPYLAALQNASIDYLVLGRRYYTENILIKQVETILRLVFDPHNQTALAGALRSAIVGLTDKEVQLLKEAGFFENFAAYQRRWSHNDLSAELLDNLESFEKMIMVLHDTCLNAGLLPMVHRLMGQVPLFEFARFYTNKTAIHESLLRIIEIAAQIDTATGFTSMVEKQNELLKKVNELSGVVDEGRISDEIDSSVARRVQIMSYHKAKGLEFDIVILADLHRQTTPPFSNLLIDSQYYPEKKVFFHYYNDLQQAEIGSTSIRELTRFKSDAEKKRLLYVGMTRAREQLYFHLFSHNHEKASTENSLAEQLKKLLEPYRLNEVSTSQWQALKAPGHDGTAFYCKASSSKKAENDTGVRYLEIPLPLQADGLSLAVADGEEDIPLSKDLYRFLSATSLRRDTNLSHRLNLHGRLLPDAIKIQNENAEEQKNRVVQNYFREASLSLQQKKKIPAKIRGIFIHLLMENCNLVEPVFDQALQNRILHSYALNRYHALFDKMKDLAVETLQAYRQSELYLLVKECEVIGREIPFSQKLEENKTAIGYIDLVLKDMLGTYYVIDHKTNNQRRKETVDQFEATLLHENETAMTLYQGAIQDFYGVSKVRPALYHAPTGKLIWY